MAMAGRKTISQLFQQGWNEIPEIMGGTFMALIGVVCGTIGCYNYVKRDGDNRRYKEHLIIMRPDDPKVKLIKKY